MSAAYRTQLQFGALVSMLENHYAQIPGTKGGGRFVPVCKCQLTAPQGLEHLALVCALPRRVIASDIASIAPIPSLQTIGGCCVTAGLALARTDMARMGG